VDHIGEIMKSQTNPRTWIALAVTILFWASGFAGIRAALRTFSPGHLVLFRFLLASGMLLVYAVLTRMALPALRDLPAITGIGFLGITVYQVAVNYGELTVTAGGASLIVATSPAFTAIMAVVFLKERLKAWGWLGIAISFAGVALITLGEGEGVQFSWGALLILLAAVVTGLYNVLQKPYLRRYSALQVGTCAIWAATLCMFVFLPGLRQAVRAAPREAILAVVYLGVFPGALAYVTWSYVLSQIQASVAGTMMYSVPVLAVLIAWLWLGEVPAVLSLVGGLVALVGIVLANLLGR
jgi:drug/metabolite transporter (DMT)-like permease